MLQRNPAERRPATRVLGGPAQVADEPRAAVFVAGPAGVGGPGHLPAAEPIDAGGRTGVRTSVSDSTWNTGSAPWRVGGLADDVRVAVEDRLYLRKHRV